MTTSLQGIVAASSLCEVFWTDPTGRPSAAGAIALWWDDAPALAFTFAAADQARRLSAAPAVCLTLTEPRSTGTAFTPVAVHGRPRLVEDLDGDVFTEHLLVQELRRYPPARSYADSLMLRRENWWYLPRLIVRVEVDAVWPVADRTDPSHYVLAVAQPGSPLRPFVAWVAPSQANMSARIEPLEDRAVPDGPTIAIGQDASFPDLEQWSTWTLRGHTTDRHLVLTEQAPEPGLASTPSLWQRLMFRRRFGRACRSAIAARRQ